jgi:hypothetical protein
MVTVYLCTTILDGMLTLYLWFIKLVVVFLPLMYWLLTLYPWFLILDVVSLLLVDT